MIDAIDYLRATGMASKSEQLPRRIMPDDKYKAFLKQVMSAEMEAKQEHKGIWADKYKTIREEEGIE